MRGGPPERRRGSSPLPQARRGDDRRGGPGSFPPPPPPRGGGGRRGRSPSPPMGGGYRRSPPPKRFRREDDFERYGPPPPHGYRDGPPPPGYYDRRGPPMGGPLPPGYRDRYDDRYGPRDGPYGGPPPNGGLDPYRRNYPPSPPRSRRQGPMTYKELMRELPDEITPEDAQKEYQAYLADWWGSEIRAQFEATKHEDAVRRRFDPREHQKAVDARNALAVSAAESFLKDFTLGDINPAAPDFNQGNGPAPAEGASDDATSPVSAAQGGSPTGSAQPGSARKAGGGERPAPKVVPEVAWQASRIASDLVLARELAAKLDAEKGVPENPLLPGADKAADAADEPAADGDSPVADGEAAAAAPKEDGEEDSPEEQAGKLDVLLTYLWRVHGVDYYGGGEIPEPEEEQRAGPRPTLRCPRPEEGEQPAEGAEAEQAAILEKGVDSVWRARLASGDPFEESLQREKIEQHMEDWIEAQIVRIDDKKWGSKVSQKLFVDKAFVIKHIRNKHAAVLESERKQFTDELYFEAFKAAREEEERLAREAAEAARRAEMGDAWGPDAGGFQADGLPAPFMGGAAGGMLGGLSVPAGCVLVPAPGAGPFGPFIPVPMDQATGGGLMGGGMGGRGRGGMGGRGMLLGNPGRGGGLGRGAMGLGGGRGGGGMGGVGGFGAGPAQFGNREYTDLDAPENQRSVLDYGDL